MPEMELVGTILCTTMEFKPRLKRVKIVKAFPSCKDILH